MSVILGYECPITNSLWIGSDGISISADSIVSYEAQKLSKFHTDDGIQDDALVILGLVGYAGTCEFLEEKYEAQPIPGTPNKFAREIRKFVMEDLDYKKEESKVGGPSNLELSGLIAWAGRGIYDMSPSGQVVRIEPGYIACRGVGAPEGAGALYALLNPRPGISDTPREECTQYHIRQALDIVSILCALCGGKNKVFSIDGNGEVKEF